MDKPMEIKAKESARLELPTATSEEIQVLGAYLCVSEKQKKSLNEHANFMTVSPKKINHFLTFFWSI